MPSAVDTGLEAESVAPIVDRFKFLTHAGRVAILGL
jgi:hypothetical protein